MLNSEWQDKEYSFFSHNRCEAFPCHNGIEPESFNCLFCFCPLYFLGKKCGGNFKISESGVKDCSDCAFPHDKKNYGLMIEKIKKLNAKEQE